MARVEKVVIVVTDSDVRVSLSPADMFAIAFMLGVNFGSEPRPISAIKYLRLQYPGMGLKDAKDVVDALRAAPRSFD